MIGQWDNMMVPRDIVIGYCCTVMDHWDIFMQQSNIRMNGKVDQPDGMEATVILQGTMVSTEENCDKTVEHCEHTKDHCDCQGTMVMRQWAS